MKALVYEEYTTDDNFGKILKIKDNNEPKPKSNEVVFKVKVAALNYDDIWGMRGKPIEIPMPHISGTDAAGEVIAVGNEVKHIQTGPLWGGYCEVTHLPEVNVVRIPDNLSYEEAAAASMTLMTSWHMLVGRASIKPGQTVLIMGGGSGMGTFGIQIAKLYNCDVIATASLDKLDKCKQLGADYAVDHRKEDWHKEVKEITKDLARKKGKPSGVDVIFEHIGGSHWNKELTLLKYGATIVTTGATTGYDVKTDLRQIFFKGINVLGSTQGTRAELESGIHWMSKGKIKAIIDSEYTFENAAEAHKKMLSGRGMFGKILMKPE